jgi:hypothetical protein
MGNNAEDEPPPNYNAIEGEFADNNGISMS